MPQPRRASLWRFLGVLACVSVLIAASLLLWRGRTCQETQQQASYSSHFSSTLVGSSVPTPILNPPQELREELSEESVAVEPEQAATPSASATGKAAEEEAPATPTAVEPSGKVDTPVIQAIVLEEPLPGEPGPSLVAASEPLGQATAEQPVSPAIAQQPAAQAEAVPPAQATGGPAHKSTLVPQWLRQLPEMVASIPKSLFDPRRPRSRQRSPRRLRSRSQRHGRSRRQRRSLRQSRSRASSRRSTTRGRSRRR